VIGERVLARFTLEERIGSGGFGTVYRAWDERLHRPVAVKVIDREAARGGRVLREAQAAARLSHPAIATLYELAEEGGRAYLVTELVEGGTLRELARAGSLSDRAVAELGADACDGLLHAHDHGVVHRDIKPHNILVAAAGEAKLVDFGVARLIGEPTLTATGSVLGTIAYMAPEQADGDRPGPTADVYSLALTLYECWAGEHPVVRDSPAATVRAIGEPIPSLGEIRPDLPGELVDVIDACLDPIPDSRAGVAGLGRALRRAAPELGTAALPPPLGVEEATDAMRLPRTRPTGIAAAVTPLVIGLLTFAVVAWGGGSPSWGWVLPPIAGAIALGRPRLAFGGATAALCAWLIAAHLPGAALVLAVLAIPLALLPAVEGAVALPAAAPILGVIGLGPVYPALAGIAPRLGTLQRAIIGGLGYMWLVAAEAISGASLLHGTADEAAGDWSSSASSAASAVLAPLFDPVALLGVALWAAAAILLVPLVRGRVLLLDLLGAVIWAAGLVAGHRLLAEQTAAGAGSPAGLLLVAALAGMLALGSTWLLRHRAAHASSTHVGGLYEARVGGTLP
jgi:hypothetical protein